MSKLVALFTLLSFTAFAQVAIPVKEAVIVTTTDETVDVKGGRYLDDAALKVVQKAFTDMENVNNELTSALQNANKKLLECSAFVPGLPGWAYAVITFGLTALTVTTAWLAVRGTGEVKP